MLSHIVSLSDEATVVPWVDRPRGVEESDAYGQSLGSCLSDESVAEGSESAENLCGAAVAAGSWSL